MDNKAESYGFFHELTGFNLGEKNDYQPRYPIINLIKQMINKTNESYSEINYLSYKRSNDFAIDSVMSAFLEKLKLSKDVNYKVPNIKLIFMLLNAITLFLCRKINLKTSLNNRYVE